MEGKSKGIHIVLSSYEYERVIRPIFDRYPIEDMYVLRYQHPTDSEEENQLLRHYLEKVKGNPFDVNLVEVDIYDFEDVFKKVNSIMEVASERELPVYINISSSVDVTNLPISALMSTVMGVKDDVHVEMFYVVPDEYTIPKLLHNLYSLDDSQLEKLPESTRELLDMTFEKGAGIGISKYENIPIFPEIKTNSLDLEIMKTLKNHECVESISHLIKLIKKNTDVKRSSLNYRLDKLKERNFIETNREDHSVKISLTRLGEMYLASQRAFSE